MKLLLPILFLLAMAATANAQQQPGSIGGVGNGQDGPYWTHYADKEIAYSRAYMDAYLEMEGYMDLYDAAGATYMPIWFPPTYDNAQFSETFPRIWRCQIEWGLLVWWP